MLREKELAQVHTGSKWLRWDLDPGLQVSPLLDYSVPKHFESCGSVLGKLSRSGNFTKKKFEEFKYMLFEGNQQCSPCGKSRTLAFSPTYF